jgi:hypothetical protein
VLFLWLEDSNLDGRVVAWSFHDGTGQATELPGAPPYPTGTAALREGWRLIQVSPLIDAAPGTEHRTGHLKHEFIFEKVLEVGGGSQTAGRADGG